MVISWQMQMQQHMARQCKPSKKSDDEPGKSSDPPGKSGNELHEVMVSQGQWDWKCIVRKYAGTVSTNTVGNQLSCHTIMNGPVMSPVNLFVKSHCVTYVMRQWGYHCWNMWFRPISTHMCWDMGTEHLKDGRYFLLKVSCYCLMLYIHVTLISAADLLSSDQCSF
jgi:hypothetical protein